MANDFSEDDNCVSLYRFESGALETDSKGSNTLSPSGDPAEDTTNFKEGSCAVSLDGNDTEYRFDSNLPSDFPFKNSTTNRLLSACLWFRPTTIPGSGNYDAILSKFEEALNGRSFRLSMHDSDLWLVTGYNSGATAEYNKIMDITEASRWYHAGLTLNGDTGAWVTRIWDDVAETANTYSGTLANTPVSCDIGPLSIGSMFNNNSPTNWFIGQIDEVVIFKDILTEAEIDQIREGTYGTFIGPTQEQIMRHGTWFGSGVKQRMWWAK